MFPYRYPAFRHRLPKVFFVFHRMRHQKREVTSPPILASLYGFSSGERTSNRRVISLFGDAGLAKHTGRFCQKRRQVREKLFRKRGGGGRYIRGAGRGYGATRNTASKRPDRNTCRQLWRGFVLPPCSSSVSPTWNLASIFLRLDAVLSAQCFPPRPGELTRSRSWTVRAEGGFFGSVGAELTAQPQSPHDQLFLRAAPRQ